MWKEIICWIFGHKIDQNGLADIFDRKLEQRKGMVLWCVRCEGWHLYETFTTTREAKKLTKII